MGYRTAPQRSKKNPNGWRILWRSEKKDSAGRNHRHIPPGEYGQLGVTASMTQAEAQAICLRLNLEENRRQRENRRNAIAIRLSNEKDLECVHLPKEFVQKFEADHLATRYLGNDTRLEKVLKLWSASQRIIRKVSKPIEQWHRYPEVFYVQFQKNAVSPGHVRNLLSTINMWVDFFGTEQDKHYRLIPAPNAVWQSRINDAFEESGNGKASLPITPDMLTGLKSPMPNEAQFNWVYCSVWAGLRPNEVNALTDKKRTSTRTINGTTILEIYQSKLKNVPKSEDRWKYIPLFLPEQERILEIISSGKIEEPLCKTLADRFGEGHSRYGGRKGFHELMVTRYSQDELEVIRWLGHKSLDMALKHYAKKDAVRWKPVKKAA